MCWTRCVLQWRWFIHICSWRSLFQGTNNKSSRILTGNKKSICLRCARSFFIIIEKWHLDIKIKQWSVIISILKWDTKFYQRNHHHLWTIIFRMIFPCRQPNPPLRKVARSQQRWYSNRSRFVNNLFRKLCHHMHMINLITSSSEKKFRHGNYNYKQNVTMKIEISI